MLIRTVSENRIMSHYRSATLSNPVTKAGRVVSACSNFFLFLCLFFYCYFLFFTFLFLSGV